MQKSGCHSSSRVSEEVAHFALRKIVEKEIDRSNATVPGDDKIGSRVSWWFAGSARYPSNPIWLLNDNSNRIQILSLGLDLLYVHRMNIAGRCLLFVMVKH
jgi:hypothetical protein